MPPDLVAAGATLAWGAVAHRYVPERMRPAASALAAVALTSSARAAGATPRDLGYGRAELARGARTGTVVSGVVVAVVAAGRALDREGRAFRDARVSDVSHAEAAMHLLVRIPLLTALVEELVFRGVILGLGLRDGDRRRAMLVSSIAFGLWHVGAALHPERRNATGGVVGHHRATVPAVVLADVAASAVAGLGLGRLRISSGSIAAPALVHAALNASAYLATRFRGGAGR